MSTTINYNSSDDVPTYKTFNVCLSNPVLVEAIEHYQRQTGMSEKGIAKEAIIRLLQEEEQIKIE